MIPPENLVLRLISAGVGYGGGVLGRGVMGWVGDGGGEGVASSSGDHLLAIYL